MTTPNCLGQSHIGLSIASKVLLTSLFVLAFNFTASAQTPRYTGPVEIIKPSGQFIPYGMGASSPSDVGTALINAQSAASSGDTIRCFADATITSSIGKSGVTYWFGPVTVTKSSGINPVIDAANKSFEIYGDAEFLNTATFTHGVLRVEGASTEVIVHCRRMESTGSGVTAIYQKNGTSHVYAKEDIRTGDYDAIWIDGGKHHFQADTVKGGQQALEITNFYGAYEITGQCRIMIGTTHGIYTEGTGTINVVIGESLYGTSYTLEINSSTTTGRIVVPKLLGGGVVQPQNVELITVTDAGNALLGATDGSEQRAILGLNKVNLGSDAVEDSVTLTTGSDQDFILIPPHLDGYNITGVFVGYRSEGYMGTSQYQIKRLRGYTANLVLSTKATIDSLERTTATAAIPAVIDPNYDDVQAGDYLYLNCDALPYYPPGGPLTWYVEFTEQ